MLLDGNGVAENGNVVAVRGGDDEAIHVWVGQQVSVVFIHRARGRRLLAQRLHSEVAHLGACVSDGSDLGVFDESDVADVLEAHDPAADDAIAERSCSGHLCDSETDTTESRD